jgi:hypothetical protein
VLPGEDDELINPGTYGKALAEYLRQCLRERSINAPFTCCEDWGWWVEVKDLPFVAGVCVYATDEMPETKEFCVSVSPAPERRWSWSRFRVVDTSRDVGRILSAVTSILEADPEVEILGFPKEYPL